MKNLLLIFVLLIFGCSASEETTEKKPTKADDTYIFDDVPEPDIIKFETPVETKKETYLIQIGAFSTREKADAFAEKSQIYLNRNITVSFNDKVKLYVVRLAQYFNSRSEAESVRNDLWQFEEYHDAWIITIKESSVK